MYSHRFKMLLRREVSMLPLVMSFRASKHEISANLELILSVFKSILKFLEIELIKSVLLHINFKAM